MNLKSLIRLGSKAWIDIETVLGHGQYVSTVWFRWVIRPDLQGDWYSEQQLEVFRRNDRAESEAVHLSLFNKYETGAS
jgi:hypothetical protein